MGSVLTKQRGKGGKNITTCDSGEGCSVNLQRQVNSLLTAVLHHINQRHPPHNTTIWHWCCRLPRSWCLKVIGKTLPAHLMVQIGHSCQMSCNAGGSPEAHNVFLWTTAAHLMVPLPGSQVDGLPYRAQHGQAAAVVLAHIFDIGSLEGADEGGGSVEYPHLQGSSSQSGTRC